MGAPLSPSQARAATVSTDLECSESSLKLEWMQDPWIDVERAGDWLLTLENDLQPGSGAFERLLPRGSAVECAASGRWALLCAVVVAQCEGRKRPRRSARGTGVPSQRDLRAADAVVAPSRAMMEQLQRYYGPLPSTAVIANGRDDATLPSGGERAVYPGGRPRLGRGEEHWILAACGAAVDWPICVAGDARHPEGRVAKLGNVQMSGGARRQIS